MTFYSLALRQPSVILCWMLFTHLTRPRHPYSYRTKYAYSIDMAAPFDLGKRVDVTKLEVGSTYYHVSPFEPYHKVKVERIDVTPEYTSVNRKYGVSIDPAEPMRNFNKFFLVNPDPVRRAILQVSDTYTPGMSARPGMGPYNMIRGYVGDGIPYEKHPRTPESPSPSSTSEGGYRATARDKKYLTRLRAGKSIGFTMRASLKAKGLLPRANGSRRVSQKYRAQKRNVTRRRA